jgi:hypothetical protein
MGRYYILRNSEVVEEPDHSVWSEWYENEYPKVERIDHTELDHCSVTTRFLALNMTLAQKQPAQVFETRVKGGWLDDQWQRYGTLDEAREGHSAWVERLREAEEEDNLPPPGVSW